MKLQDRVGDRCVNVTTGLSYTPVLLESYSHFLLAILRHFPVAFVVANEVACRGEKEPRKK